MTAYPAVPAQEGAANYAGFWIRFGAFLIDAIILGIIGGIIGFIIGVAMGGDTDPVLAQGISGFIGFLIGVAYFVVMESSERQGTLGKAALGLKVVDMEGGRIPAGQAAIRYFSKILSSLILLIGYVMIAFTPRKQGLHDIIAKTLVVKQ
ncbi:MAG: RDD family protein [Actinomycetota bacterium]